MSTVIATHHVRQVGHVLRIHTCPCWDPVAAACACPDQGKSHTRHDFSASSGDPNDTRTPADWAAACALEARRLVAAASAQPAATTLSQLAGATGT